MKWTLFRGATLAAILILTNAVTDPATAANADFQDFFTDLCTGPGTPTGALAARCTETGGGTGDGNLSGDSESSLNPSQTLSSNDASLAVARSRSKETRERGERLREGESSLGDDAVAQSFGRWSLLAHVRGEWFEADRNAGADSERGYDGDLWAVEAGLDYRVTDRFILGAIIAYEELDSDFDQDLQEGAPFDPAPSAGTIESESTEIILFGSYAPGSSIYLDAAFGFRSSDYTLQRNSVFQESGRSTQLAVRTEGTPDGDGWWASLNLGFDMQRGAWSLGPYAGVATASSEIDAYTEEDLNGSGLNMEVSETERDSVLAHLGFRASYAISTTGGVWVPQFRLEWNHEFDNDPLNVVTGFALDASDTDYRLVGAEPDEDYFNAGFGLLGVLRNGWIPFVDGEVLFGHEDFDRYRITLGLRKEF